MLDGDFDRKGISLAGMASWDGLLLLVYDLEGGTLMNVDNERSSTLS